MTASEPVLIQSRDKQQQQRLAVEGDTNRGTKEGRFNDTAWYFYHTRQGIPQHDHCGHDTQTIIGGQAITPFHSGIL